MKSRDSRDILRDKQTAFSLNNNTALPWKGKNKINVPKKELQL